MNNSENHSPLAQLTKQFKDRILTKSTQLRIHSKAHIPMPHQWENYFKKQKEDKDFLLGNIVFYQHEDSSVYTF